MLAGARLIERQLDVALAAGCETIVCLATHVGREIIDLQHRAEVAGARFIALKEPQKLSGIVSATDELLVFSAGLLPEEEQVLKHLAKPAVLTFPADTAVTRGYERIDANFAWAGAMMAHGSSVESLAQMPPDVDVPSALLRISLQAGLRTHPLEVRLLDENIWLREPTAEELAEREKHWIGANADLTPFSAPGLAIAERLAARIARDTIHNRLPQVVGLTAALFAALASMTATWSWSVASFGFATLTAALVAMEKVVRRIATAGQVRPRTPLVARILQLVIDPLLLFLIALASPEDTGWLRVFVPAMLLGVLHLGERLSISKWRRSYADRALLALLFVPAAFLGLVQPIAAVLAFGLLITLFITSEPRS